MTDFPYYEPGHFLQGPLLHESNQYKNGKVYLKQKISIHDM